MTGRDVRRARRLGATLLGICTVLATTAGCALGPSQRGDLAVSGAQTVHVTTTQTAPRPLGPGGPGRSSDPITWEGCGPSGAPTGGSSAQLTVECATVPVPLDYDRPRGQQLDLSVARARQQGLPADAPALLVLAGPGADAGNWAGGPGDWVADITATAAALPSDIRSHYAVITVDIRGTGTSEPVDCLTDADTRDLIALGPDPTTPASGQLLTELARSITFDCTATGGPDLTRYNSTAAADDLDTVRAALGVDRIALLGRGFGATLGAVYADRYPGRVSAAVLDAPADPLADPSQTATDVARAAQRSLTAFAASCAGFAGGCALGKDPAATVTTVVAALGEQGTASADGHLITGGSAILALLGELGAPARWPALADALAAAERGDTTALARLLAPVAASAGDRLLYACNDHALRLSPQQLAADVTKGRSAAPLFGPYASGLVALCSGWPAPQAALGPVRATGAPPILVLGSVDDPLAPYAQVQSVAGQLSSATLVSWQSWQHGSYPASPCMTTIVDAYLLSGAVPAIGTLCPP